MLRKYQSMFESVANVMEAYADVHAPTIHPTLQTQWNDDYQSNTDSLLSLVELNPSEKQAFERVQDVFSRGLQIFLEEATHRTWSDLSKDQRLEKIKRIMTCPQIPQRTVEWYRQGQELLTASEFATLYGSERSYANLVIAKAIQYQARPLDIGQRSACLTCQMGPFDWGIRFEPVVKQVFEQHWGAKIGECGRITHGTDTQLAASPDGIFTEAADVKMLGRLIEIKCPISRPIGNGIPFEYWCQMQIQMEVCDVDECQYIEVKLNSTQAKKTVATVTDQPFAAGNLYILEKEEGFYVYAYKQESYEDYIQQGFILKETVPWSIHSYATEVVQRDTKWFESTAVLRERFWTNVAAAKAGTFKAPPPLPPRQKPCLISDSSPPSEATPIEQTPSDIQ